MLDYNYGKTVRKVIPILGFHISSYFFKDD